MTDQPDCGIIMPISHVDDVHTEAHWQKVKDVLEAAITKAELKPQPVWLNSSSDVIQAKILKNLFENELIVCDISTRNPNVMLELGMRLTTKRPTIIVAEKGTRLPFDTNVIATEFYNPSLEYGETVLFIGRLVNLLRETREAVTAGTYHAYLEHFRFETIDPETVSVTANEVIERRLDDLVSMVGDLQSRAESPGIPWGQSSSISGRAIVDGQRRSSHFNYTPEGDLKERNNGCKTQEPDDATRVNPALKVGKRVHHAKFGDGTVAGIEGSKAEIDFDTAGRKRTMQMFVSIIDP